MEKAQKGKIYIRYIENLLRELFCYTMSDLLSGYNHCLTILANEDIPLFNKESFIENKSKNQKKFYNDFTSTQIFLQFLQTDSRENFTYFHKIDTINKNQLNTNSRKNTFIPKIVDLDISKYFHLNLNSSNRSSLISNDNTIIDSSKENLAYIRNISNSDNISNKNIQATENENENNKKKSNKKVDKKLSETFSIKNLLGSYNNQSSGKSNSINITNTTNINDLANINKNQKLNYIIDDNYLCNFKEIYYLFPYFHDMNENIILKNDYIKDYNYFAALMNKYFDDEILKETNVNKVLLKSHSLLNKKNEFLVLENDLEIKDISQRVFENFRILDMNKIPDKFIRYNIPNYIPVNLKKNKKKHSSILNEFEKRIESKIMYIDNQNRKTHIM
jgi:hypothetical protein